MERYRNYIRPYQAAFIAGPILMLTEVAGEIALPKMMSLIINNGVANHDVGYILRIGAAMIGFAMLMLLGGVGGNLLRGKGLSQLLGRPAEGSVSQGPAVLV